MGGYSFCIEGQINNELSNRFKDFKKGDQNNFLIPSYAEPIKIRFANQEKRITITEKGLEGLKSDFTNFLSEIFKNRWTSTDNFIEYINLDTVDIYLRGRHDLETNSSCFYIQMAFGGAGGLGEVSSALASHWAAKWFAVSKERLKKEYFDQVKLVPFDKAITFREEFKFIPISKFGYALYYPNWYDESETDFARNFRVDGDVIHFLRERNELQHFSIELDSLSHFVEENGCCCQMCNPEFDDVEIIKTIEKYFK